jgi:SAM-dependent methyltransferase
MAKITTAERVSQEASDNYVFQRSLLAYHRAAEIVSGDVLEIGTGTGYGVKVLAPKCSRYITIDKFQPSDVCQYDNVEYYEMCVPPIGFEGNSFDFVVSFQVIEHIEKDVDFVREVSRVLRPGGKFIVSTPNALMSLTRNPWHVREYNADELELLLKRGFSSVERMGVYGNERVMEYYEQNRRGVERITRFDILDLQHRMPRWILQIPYDILNRLNRRRLLAENQNLTTSITMEDYTIGQLTEQSFDLYYIATK